MDGAYDAARRLMGVLPAQVLDASLQRMMELVAEADPVLDVGGWADPLPRADWVIDLLPYETRGLYGREVDPNAERFSAQTWIERDICDREPWPFADGQFEFVVCSHTLEDVRDPVWVCNEMIRVARAGYIEVPSRLEEQSYGVHGSWVGWTHHRWLVDIEAGGIQFVFKPHLLHSRPDFHFTAELGAELTPDERVQCLFWERGFACGERIFTVPEELERYLGEFVADHTAVLRDRHPTTGRANRLLRRLTPGRR